MADLQLGRELDPAIWSKAPHDILLKIIEHSDPSTQTSWSCTSRNIFLDASSIIWNSLCLRSSDIKGYISTVSGQRSPNRADGIVHFLLESAYRRHNLWDHVFAKDRTGGVFIYRPNGVEKYCDYQQLIATLPVSHVKYLEVDHQGFDIAHPIANRNQMDLTLRTLLKRLPKLRSLKYVGPFSDRTLAAIIPVHSLRELQVRNSKVVVEMPTNTSRFFNMRWIDLAQDWSVLADLKGLQSLEVGRLMREEAAGLAQGIAALPLRRLHVSSWGWEYKDWDPSTTVRPSTYTSALVMFLDALMEADLQNDHAHGGLPSTMVHLVLIDKYYSCIPSLHQLLATAISPCAKLETLSITICVNGRCYENISKMGLPAYNRIIGLGSWQQLSCDEEMTLLHQYRGPSSEILQTNPYPRPLRNIVKTLDQIVAAAKGSGGYRMSMNFTCGREFRNDEILICPCKEEHDPSAAEKGPQAQDGNMLDLVDLVGSLSLEESQWAYWLQSWDGTWEKW